MKRDIDDEAAAIAFFAACEEEDAQCAAYEEFLEAENFYVRDGCFYEREKQ